MLDINVRCLGVKKLLILLSFFVSTASIANFVDNHDLKGPNTQLVQTEHQLQYLMYPSINFAIVNSRYGTPTHLPTLILINKEVIWEKINCTQNCDKDVSSYYDHNTETIYIDSNILNIPITYAMGLMVHEFVHFLQFNSGEQLITCKDREFLETEAIQIQTKFLRSRRMVSNIVPTVVCEENTFAIHR